MVFRFTPTQDCGMMRELIRLKPFAAERGTALDVWDKSHYSDVDGLVRDYIKLERLHQDDKAEKKLSKQRKEADLAQGAIDIVSESNRCRAHRQNDESGSDDSHKQFEDRLAFEKEQVEARLQFEKQLQIRNSEMILECANIFSAAISKNKE
ncbi:hypothetical protein JG687_00011028 [Phytophthora cactorum]|uniref:Uncharacterized protein n=1 Tax=Phytophthora cactorum TaxID=29920 RepID=A0A8T1U6W1_9STRA|nr:hypothetical protein JG687_00011028 [Phytophthora cactorum]